MSQNLAALSKFRLRIRHRRSSIVLALCLGFFLASPAYGRQDSSSAAGNRTYRKAAKKAHKDMQKYNKRQLKAMKRSAKAQKKALKRARRNQAHY
jgi:hypothetical protein